MAQEQRTHEGIATWRAYYSALLAQEGAERLRRVKSRLYEKLESINEEIESLEEDRERIFGRQPEIVTFIEREVESLITTGREVSIRLETVIGLLGEE
ncbi:hypothetical protein D3C87_705830 [compost metagenome]